MARKKRESHPQTQKQAKANAEHIDQTLYRNMDEAKRTGNWISGYEEQTPTGRKERRTKLGHSFDRVIRSHSRRAR